MNTDNRENIKKLIETVGANLTDYQKCIMTAYIRKREPQYFTALRQNGYQMLQETSDVLATIARATGTFYNNFLVGMDSFIKAFHTHYVATETTYRKEHPRVVHLAYNAKKARVRKKNRNRIRRMK